MLKFWLVILFTLVGLKALPQVTPNIGFDDGSFTHWECWAGSVSNGLSLTLTGPYADRHTIMSSKTDLDIYGHFPVKCPNGSPYSIKLGNSATGAQAERVSYTFTVPASGEYSVIFDYAVVLQNPQHDPSQQPRFTARVFNVSDNNYNDCPSFDFIASTDLPGFKLSDFTGDGSQNSVYFKEWSKATIDLHNYPNKIMRIEFTTNDCTQGGHFGYAYLDVENSDITAPITGNAYCNNQNSVTLLGPSGFATYNWYNADQTQMLGTERSLTISPAPPNNMGYKLHVEPFLGLGCADDLYTVVNKIDADFNLVVKSVINVCPGSAADLTADSVTAGSTAATFSYFNDAAALDEMVDPGNITKPGTYYIRGISKDGCTNILPVQVVAVKPPTLIITDPSAVTFPTSVDLSATFVHDPGLAYTYQASANAPSALASYIVNHSGVYYVKAVNGYGCTIVKPINVVVHPPPPIAATCPNTFTPNGDGINDHFVFSASGNYTFFSLRVYNRNGKLLFTTKSADGYWDGTYNGKNVPVGAYYWVFEGRDDYTNMIINRGGPIILIR